jgi:magnesium-transporting ATPase (P-type)
MSVVIRDEQQRVIVYCKGADNIILDRAASFAGTEQVRCQLLYFEIRIFFVC